MKLKLLIVILSALIPSPAFCQSKTDSMGLANFVRKVYRWHNREITEDKGFDPVKFRRSDTMYSGIDISAVNFMVHKLRRSGFFDEIFLTNYRHIAFRMNEQLRAGKSKWREGDLPPFNHNADPWCDCADAAGDYWSKISLSDIEPIPGGLSLQWTRGDRIFHTIRVKKVKGMWKINYLEGYDQSKYRWTQ